LTKESPVPPCSDELLDAYIVELGPDLWPLVTPLSRPGRGTVDTDLVDVLEARTELDGASGGEDIGAASVGMGLANGKAGVYEWAGAVSQWIKALSSMTPP
jgi:hypothetical protein